MVNLVQFAGGKPIYNNIKSTKYICNYMYYYTTSNFKVQSSYNTKKYKRNFNINNNNMSGVK